MLQRQFGWLATILILLCGRPILLSQDRDATRWISALEHNVKQSGHRKKDRFRYAAASHLSTTKDGSALELDFEGSGIAVRLGGHNVPAYGSTNQGTMIATVDGKARRTFSPLNSPREIVRMVIRIRQGKGKKDRYP